MLKKLSDKYITYKDIKKIEECATQYDIFRYLKIITKFFSYNYFIVIDIGTLGVQNSQKIQEILWLTNWPREFVHAYDKHNLLDTCPVVKWCLLNSSPLIYDLNSLKLVSAGEFGETAFRIFTEFNLVSGVIVPIHNPKSGVIAFGMQGDRPDPSPEELRDILWIANLLCVQMAAIQQITRTNTVDISDRERECLSLTAAGKTSEEIANIIGLSPHTVDYYLGSACRKLRTSNRTHAVATAIRLKIIV